MSFAKPATTIAPPGALGTAKVVVKDPAESMIADAIYGVVTPLKDIVALLALPVVGAGKPNPLTVTDVPTGPEVGLTVSDGTTVRNTAKTTLFASTMVMLCRPFPVTGTVTVVLKNPVPLAKRLVGVMSIELSHLKVALPGANQLPTILTLCPTPAETVAVKSVKLPYIPVAFWMLPVTPVDLGLPKDSKPLCISVYVKTYCVRVAFSVAWKSMPLDAGGTLSPAAFTTGPMMSGAAKV